MPAANNSLVAGNHDDIIVIGNLQDGVGESTLATGLAGGMAPTFKSVAPIEGDPQAISRRWLVKSDMPVRVESMDLHNLGSLES